MNLQEPPLLPDDTQPTVASHLNQTNRPQTGLSVWVLLALLVFSVLSLIATISFAFSGSAPVNPESSTMQVVTLLMAGESRDIQTTAATVNDFLLEQGIQLNSDDAISPSPDTALSDGLLITIARARSVNLVVDGEEQTIRTPFDNPAAILAQENIALRPIDLIWLDGTSATLDELSLWPVPVNEIMIQHAFQVTVIDGDAQTTIETTAATIGDALYDAGITIYLSDTVTPEQGQALTSDTTVTIDRARPIKIQVDGVELETRVSGTTVADALTEASIPLAAYDYTIPAETAPIEAGMTISVLRVTESMDTYDETIPYETVYQANPDIELDQRQVVQAGQIGLRRYFERVRYENGIEVGREPAGSEIVKAPQNEVVNYGTNIVIRTINTPDGARDYWRVLRVYATSYKPEAVGGSTTTAIGETLQHGVIGADPNIIPYRTNLYIEGYGIGMVADTGGARSSPYWIDLGYSDEDYKGWHWYVDAYLLTPVPDNVDYLLPTWRPMRGLPDN